MLLLGEGKSHLVFKMEELIQLSHLQFANETFFCSGQETMDVSWINFFHLI